jgi:exodeoxyribonuclease VII large subunit
MSCRSTISSTPSTRWADPAREGARVVLQAKPTFWAQRGPCMLDARQIRPVGVGELLARLEYLKRHLAQEGLFDRDRKRPLPFLPRRIGLVTGRAAPPSAMSSRTPAAVGPRCNSRSARSRCRAPPPCRGVRGARRARCRHPEVDVIVIARGGGGVEDLLPFSNETLLRAVAAAVTPVVSAIGHDVDTPLLDFVADVRASTPTDAAKLIVPDAAAERDRVAGLRGRARLAVRHRLDAERRVLVAHRTRAVMTDPLALLAPHPPSSRPCAGAPPTGCCAPGVTRKRPDRAPARAGALALPSVDPRPRVCRRQPPRRPDRSRPGRGRAG